MTETGRLDASGSLTGDNRFNERKNLHEDVQLYVTRVLKESGERKNRGFREELNLPTPPKAGQRSR